MGPFEVTPESIGARRRRRHGRGRRAETPRAIRRWRWRRPREAKAPADRQADGATREQPATDQGRGGLEKDRVTPEVRGPDHGEATRAHRPFGQPPRQHRKEHRHPRRLPLPGSPAPALPVSPPSAGAPAHARLVPRSHRVHIHRAHRPGRAHPLPRSRHLVRGGHLRDPVLGVNRAALRAVETKNRARPRARAGFSGDIRRLRGPVRRVGRGQHVARGR